MQIRISHRDRWGRNGLKGFGLGLRASPGSGEIATRGGGTLSWRARQVETSNTETEQGKNNGVRVMKQKIGMTIAAGVWVVVAGGVMAEEVTFGQRTPSTEEIIEALKPKPRTRGIRPARESRDKPAMSMELKFAFDSYELTEKAKADLDHLGEALRSEALEAFRFRIEGHTDAVGDEQYNKVLSQKRAEAVKTYLVTRHKVPAERLEVIGMGEEQPVKGEPPESGANRRVAIINLTP